MKELYTVFAQRNFIPTEEPNEKNQLHNLFDDGFFRP